MGTYPNDVGGGYIIDHQQQVLINDVGVVDETNKEKVPF